MKEFENHTEAEKEAEIFYSEQDQIASIHINDLGNSEFEIYSATDPANEDTFIYKIK